MIFFDRSTHHTDVGPYQCYLGVNVRMLSVVEKVKKSFILLFEIIFLFSIMISVIMPPSALDTLTRLNINYPMLFKLSNKRNNRITHCGVLEFIADEEKIYIPYWVIYYL